MLPAAATTPPSPDPVLSAQGLVLRYPGAARAALEGVDLELAAGEIVGLLGPNGAGKTTTVGILSTLLRPTGGRVRCLGVDLLAHPRRVRGQIGLVPQEVALYDTLSVRENMEFFGRMYGLGGARLAAGVAWGLEAAGLAGAADRPVRHLSGGLRRRANLAAGLVHGPRLLFLDEPTVGVDAQSRQRILDALGRLAAAGTAMLYTTHYMEEAQGLCRRVVVIDHGRVIAEGPPEELIRRHPPAATLGEVFLALTGRELRD
jgi:ABC-2 type transport system ATP-binding protein